MTAPAAPTNVRLVYADGTHLPVQCVFAGYTDDGIARWVVVDGRPDEIPAGILVETLPAKSAVSVVSARPDG
jgi:hypothetical protein